MNEELEMIIVVPGDNNVINVYKHVEEDAVVVVNELACIS